MCIIKSQIINYAKPKEPMKEVRARRNEMTGEGTPHKKIVSRYHSKN